MICATCGRDPDKVNTRREECSHVSCPHRVSSWADVPTPLPDPFDPVDDDFNPFAGLLDEPGDRDGDGEP